MPLTLRSARIDDAATIVDFNVAMAEETEGKPLARDVVDRGVRALLADETKGFYLLAEIDGRVVGQLMVTREWSDWRDGFFWWIQSVYVAARARRSGVYRALHGEIERRAREANACGIRLYVERDNRVAQSTYRAMGMAPTHYELYEVELSR